MNGTYLLALIAFIWFVMIMWKDILKFLKFIFKPFRRIKKCGYWFFNLKGDKRNIGIIILAAISGLWLLAYFYCKSKGIFDKDTIPDTLLVILVSAPVAWGLWNWRNKDKHIELFNDKLVANTDFFLTFAEKITNTNTDRAVKMVALKGLTPFFTGIKGISFAEQSNILIRHYFNELQSNHLINPFGENEFDKEFFQVYRSIILSRITTLSIFNLEISGYDLTGLYLNNYHIYSNFDRCYFIKNNLSKLKFENCKFSYCFFYGTRVEECTFINCTFEFSKIQNSEFYMSIFKGCYFDKVFLDEVGFSGTIENCTVEGCFKKDVRIRNNSHPIAIPFFNKFSDDIKNRTYICFNNFLPNFKIKDKYIKEEKKKE